MREITNSHAHTQDRIENLIGTNRPSTSSPHRQHHLAGRFAQEAEKYPHLKKSLTINAKNTKTTGMEEEDSLSGRWLSSPTRYI